MIGKINPPLLYQCAILLMVVFHLLFPIAKIIPFPFNLVGVSVFILGAWIALRAKRLFQQTNTPIKPTASPILLHKNGFFRFTRNPMYLGITIALVGIAILLGSIITFVFPLLFLLIMNFVFIPHEEKLLQSAFGEQFVEYKNDVPRWIGIKL